MEEVVANFSPELRVRRAAEGRSFVAKGQNYWGVGSTIGEALDNLKVAGGSLSDAVVIYDAGEGAYINEYGQVTWKTGQAPPDIVCLNTVAAKNRARARVRNRAE